MKTIKVFAGLMVIVISYLVFWRINKIEAIFLPAVYFPLVWFFSRYKVIITKRGNPEEEVWKRVRNRTGAQEGGLFPLLERGART